MAAEAPALLVAIESSGIAAAIRQSVWIYPAANVLHVVGIVLLAGAVAVMDLRLLGAFSATRPADVVEPARRATLAALALLVSTGLVLFAAEASHVGTNPVFLAKMALIATAVANALLIAGLLRTTLPTLEAGAPMPARLRLAAGLSLALWIAVPELGRLIAYV